MEIMRPPLESYTNGGIVSVTRACSTQPDSWQALLTRMNDEMARRGLPVWWPWYGVVWLMNWRCANRPLPSLFFCFPPPLPLPLSLSSFFRRTPRPPASSFLFPRPISARRYYIYSFFHYNSSGECERPNPALPFTILSTPLSLSLFLFFAPFSRSPLHAAPPGRRFAPSRKLDRRSSVVSSSRLCLLTPCLRYGG